MAKKNVVGKCHICGKKKKLSFEHVPPRKAFNSKSCIMLPGKQIRNLIKSNYMPWEWKEAQLPYEKKRRGIGDYTLCKRCNNWTGGRYAPAFIKFVHQGYQSLLQKLKNKKIEEYSIIKMKFEDIDFMAVAKQIFTMFCSINNPDFSENNLDIRKFILNPDCKGYPANKYSLYFFLLAGELVRYIGLSSILDIQNKITRTVSELQTPPFGFVLMVDSPALEKSKPREFTDFIKGRSLGEEFSLSVDVPVFESNTQYPLDFREKSEVLKAKIANAQRS